MYDHSVTESKRGAGLRMGEQNVPALFPKTEKRTAVMGKISLDDSVNAAPCSCTACSSCRCTPCK